MNGRDLCPNCGQPVHPGDCEGFSGYQSHSREKRQVNLNDMVLVTVRSDEKTRYFGKVVAMNESEFQVVHEHGYYNLKFKFNDDLEVKVLFSACEQCYGEEFQVGAIVENVTDEYVGLRIGQILEISEDRKQMKVRWHKGSYNPFIPNDKYEEAMITYPYSSEDMIPSVIIPSEDAKFSEAFTKGRIIGYGDKNDLKKNLISLYEYILNVSEDRRTIEIEQLNVDTRYAGKKGHIVSRTFFEHYYENIYCDPDEWKFLQVSREHAMKELERSIRAIEAEFDY